MINSIDITGYRSLSRLSLDNLGQINLIVGTNNSGKTSILEAIYLLTSSGDPSAIWKIITQRGEQLPPDVTPGKQIQQELDISHLFYNHKLSSGSYLSITSNGDAQRSIDFTVSEARREDNPALYAQLPQENLTSASLSQLAVTISGTPNPLAKIIPLSSRGGFRQEIFQLLVNMAANSPRVDESHPQYISTNSLSIHELVSIFNSISLTKDEDFVLNALRFIEPDIERIATAPISPFVFPGSQTKGGFKAKLKDLDQPIPIGSMGDGIWRMLSLAIALTMAKNSVILLDDIDTGFHHTVMDKMWKLVFETSKALNVQVFATTHSNDCVKSVASICNHEDPEHRISLQRIEPGMSETIVYNEAEIIISAEDNIEVR
jgi:predicted ATPase